MARYHVSEGARTQGELVLCEAMERPCPRGGDEEHLFFNNDSDVQEYQELSIAKSVGDTLSYRQDKRLKELQEESDRNNPAFADTTVWSVDDFDWDNPYALDDADYAMESLLSDLRYYNPDREGYLMVATPSSPRYGWQGLIGIGGGGKGYNVVGNLKDGLMKMSDLKEVKKDKDGTMIVETSNHDFMQKIVVYRLTDREYDKLYNSDWDYQNDFAEEIEKKPLSFKKGT